MELGIYWVVLSVLIDKDLYTSISTKIIFGKGLKIIVHFLGIYSDLLIKHLIVYVVLTFWKINFSFVTIAYYCFLILFCTVE